MGARWSLRTGASWRRQKKAKEKEKKKDGQDREKQRRARGGREVSLSARRHSHKRGTVRSERTAQVLCIVRFGTDGQDAARSTQALIVQPGDVKISFETGGPNRYPNPGSGLETKRQKSSLPGPFSRRPRASLRYLGYRIRLHCL